MTIHNIPVAIPEPEIVELKLEGELLAALSPPKMSPRYCPNPTDYLPAQCKECASFNTCEYSE